MSTSGDIYGYVTETSFEVPKIIPTAHKSSHSGDPLAIVCETFLEEQDACLQVWTNRNSRINYGGEQCVRPV